MSGVENTVFYQRSIPAKSILEIPDSTVCDEREKTVLILPGKIPAVPGKRVVNRIREKKIKYPAFRLPQIEKFHEPLFVERRERKRVWSIEQLENDFSAGSVNIRSLYLLENTSDIPDTCPSSTLLIVTEGGEITKNTLRGIFLPLSAR